MCLREVLEGTFLGSGQRTTPFRWVASTVKTVYLSGPAQRRRKHRDVIQNGKWAAPPCAVDKRDGGNQ